ncbi:xylose operon regulatory protein [Rhodopirellula maiorica SM1]|uniref:Xylose operon regulatory protein n=1 Tax=Rhodopirellula maiorica SM1 TaxID=1265738 RepID=M5RQS6_9BACT|nr:xylose operon transcription regulator XylR [Rhodopirellula maiorica]EMI17737.1 xylose operon regulatory protein [Rhodopirellula maiorica SM1]
MAKTRLKRKNDPPQVAILVDTSTGWGQRLIRGVTSYARQHGPWHLWVEPKGRDEAMQLPPDWNGDGVIARVGSARLATDLQSLNTSVVNVCGIKMPESDAFPRVTTDYATVAALATEYFRSRGFRRFAYVGPTRHSYVRRHVDAFRGALAQFDAELSVFNFAHESLASKRWKTQEQKLGQWLKEIAKPVAVFSWGTTASARLLKVCRLHNVLVPDEVSVLAGDDDDLICEATVPSMSAVLISSEQIGFRAAARLDRLMKGMNDDGSDVLIDPIEVVTRGSTDALAIEDFELARAVRYMRERAFGELTVAEVADHVPMTRRNLERKFREMIGRTPLQEIHRLRIARVKELLSTSDLAMPAVAAASGFGTPEYMTQMFKSIVGQTPLRYRSMTRAR